MLGFLYRLFVGNFKSCNHVWEIKDTYNTKRISIDPKVHNTISGTYYIMKCKHCGELNREHFPIL